ncbi:hypothetical protein HX049_15915 [Myroides odoratimimus]|uniref:hypothetical protein n=1 Tax=Myroides odoratimimus TaxID=76832 RepID=UPI002575C063|nr:hypothetical protein [Myroides odoratimimus]MDM1398633.1 hypothetical protein [Myroides odoratimimus]
MSSKDAKKQGAFIQWNHPPYKQKTKDQWEAPQQRLLEEGLLDGIEIVGHTNLFTKAMQWADQYQLTITSSSDIHYLIDTKHEFYHRPITLIFAKENTVESIKEALFQKRSIAYYKDQLIGDKKFTEAIFTTSIKAEYFDCSTEKKSKTFALNNTSDIPFKLTLIQATRQYNYPKEILSS